MDYLQCWVTVAKALFAQAIAGGPELIESGSQAPSEEGTCFVAELGGGLQGRFSVVLDRALLIASAMGAGVDQKEAWAELLREVAEAAAGELLARTGTKCQVLAFRQSAVAPENSRALELKMGERSYSLWVVDSVRPTPNETSTTAEPQSGGCRAADSCEESEGTGFRENKKQSQGLELLMDIEMEVALRFGCRELLLGELLDLGPGDVVELDRHISDPVDLIVGDKIVARGEVVLVNGNFGLRVTEVAAPRKRLESIRCLY